MANNFCSTCGKQLVEDSRFCQECGAQVPAPSSNLIIEKVAVDFVAAKCPQCSANLQVPRNCDIVKCMYCGGDIVIKQAAKRNTIDTNNLNELGWDAINAGNYVEAYRYFTKVVERDPNHSNAWIGKGIAAGWQSTPQRPRLKEMFIAFEKSVQAAPKEIVNSVQEHCAKALQDILNHCGKDPELATVIQQHSSDIRKFAPNFVPPVPNEPTTLTCPHCYAQVPRGATVCRGCKAEVHYGAGQTSFWVTAILGIWIGSMTNWFWGIVCFLFGIGGMLYMFRDSVEFKDTLIYSD